MNKIALSIVLAGFGCFTGCQKEPPARFDIDVSLEPSRAVSLIGTTGIIDVSSAGDFTQSEGGRVVDNAIPTRNDSYSNLVTFDLAEHRSNVFLGEELVIPTDGRLSVHFRHWTGAPLTSDNCRDIGEIFSASTQHGVIEPYQMRFHHVEADRHGCVYAVQRIYP